VHFAFYQQLHNLVKQTSSMAYDTKLADRIREYLVEFTRVKIEEKKMFGGLGFIINNKMCINVSGENLMCRYDPELQDEVSEKEGFESMIMKGKELKGYCYVHPEGFQSKRHFEYWMNLALSFNEKAKSSKKRKM
jgi:TfoX/Sxy family transcriptional regulator of competence genes